MAATEVNEGIVVEKVIWNHLKKVKGLVLSTSKIDTLDLLSEGEIDGLITGKWSFSGNLGEVGWRTGTFTPYKIPTGESYSGTHYLRSVYWNEMPVLNDAGQFNFQNVDVAHTNGLPNGEILTSAAYEQTISRSLNERFRDSEENAKFYRILNKECKGVIINIKFSSLYESLISSRNIDGYDYEVGSTVRTRVDYNIYYRPIFSSVNSTIDFYAPVSESVYGRIQNGYVRSTRIDFDLSTLENKDFVGWEIKLVRLTKDSTSAYLQNQTYIESLTEIYGNIYTYPNSAIVRGSFKAEFFSKIPDRAFEVNLLKVKVPGNYNPILRTYAISGFATENSGWNGEFATGKQWTNNAAWCFYDLLTNKRYGLGKHVTESYVDKFTLYEISKNCDTLVADGEGGLEPRFTCNLILNTREEAYKVLNDMASAFYGMLYYSNGMVYTAQDSAQDPVLEFTNASVEDGDFNYSSIARKQRYTVAVVRWNDPKNFYKPAIEYVEDVNGIRKYGIMETDISAFGCTSRGQAIRLGRWNLITNNTETETITFNVGTEGAYLRPGRIFKVFDANRRTKRHGGRIDTIVDIDGTGSRVTLDSTISLDSNVEYKFSVLTPSYNYNTSLVSGLNSNDYSNINKSFLQVFSFSGFQTYDSNDKTVIDLYSGFNTTDYYASGNPVWLLELSDRYSTYTGARYFTDKTYDYYRTLNIRELDVNKYEVVGLQYYYGKYSEIESGLVFDKYTMGLSKIPGTPRNLMLDTDYSQNEKHILYSFIQDSLTNVNSFKVYIKNGAFIGAGVPVVDGTTIFLHTLDSSVTNGNYSITENGTWYFRIYASNDIDGILSASYVENSIEISDIEQMMGILVSSLKVDNSDSDTVYTTNKSSDTVTLVKATNFDPVFSWQVGYQDGTVLDEDLKFRVSIRPVINEFLNARIPSETVLYQETGIVPTGGIYKWSFPLDKNISIAGGPYRQYQVVVEAHNSGGMTSVGNQIGVSDNKWNTNPYGYDVLVMNNPRQTGIELSDNIQTNYFSYGTYTNVISGYYISEQFFGGDGSVILSFSSGEFNSDLVGGYIYTSSVPFPKDGYFYDDYWNSKIQREKFSFDPDNPNVNIPTAGIKIRGSPLCFMSVSFFDKLDQAMIDKGIDISSGLYVSNNSIAYNDASVGSISIGGATTIFTVQVTGYPELNSEYVSLLIGTGSTEIARTSTLGTGNTTGNVTTILYMSYPLNSADYTGYAGGSFTSGSQIIKGGISRKAISDISGINRGGYASGTLVLTGSDYGQENLVGIETIKVGDIILCPVLKGSDLQQFDYTGDNWQTWRTNDGGYSLSYFTGSVSKIENYISKSYFVISGQDTVSYNDYSITGTYEQPIFLARSELSSNLFIPIGNINITGDNYIAGMVNCSIKEVNSQIKTYSLYVEPYKTFFVGETLGISHNSIYKDRILISKGRL